MRIAIRHVTTYTYSEPVDSVIQLLRLTPRSFAGQSIRRWRIDLNHDGLLKAGEDAFGNTLHTLSLKGPLSTLVVAADGEVETTDTNGMVDDAVERFPVGLYLRATDLTRPDAHITAFARDAAGDVHGNRLDALHRLMAAVHQTMTFDTRPTNSATTAVDAFNMKTGVCQDLSHVFIAGARSLGIPARYVGGYLWRADGGQKQHQDAGHAWAEAYVPDLGWVGFDPANGVSSTAAHVRVAIGLDYTGAAPVRGARSGGPEEKLSVSVLVDQASRRQDQ